MFAGDVVVQCCVSMRKGCLQEMNWLRENCEKLEKFWLVSSQLCSFSGFYVLKIVVEMLNAEMVW